MFGPLVGGATGSYALRAARIRLGNGQISLENAGGRAHATFAYSVTPTLTEDTLQQVPSGLPLVPPLTAWYATTNVWHVTV